MTTRGSHKSLVVAIERVAAIDDAAVAAAAVNSSKNNSAKVKVNVKPTSELELGCFLCGKKSRTRLTSLSQGRRHYLRQVEMFQGYLNGDDVDRNVEELDGSGMGIESCATCLKMVKRVWDLNQQIAGIREDIENIVERARSSMPQRLGGGSLKDQRQHHRPNKLKNPRPLRGKSVKKAKSRQHQEKVDVVINPGHSLDIDKEETEFKQEVPWSPDGVDVEGTDEERGFDMLAIYPEPETEQPGRQSVKDTIPRKVDSHSKIKIPSSSPPPQGSHPSPNSNSSRPRRVRKRKRIFGEDTDSMEEINPAPIDSDTDKSSAGEEETSDSESDGDSDGRSKIVGKQGTASSLCPQCGKEFTTRNYLQSHIRRVHERFRPHKCDHCEQSFSNVSHRAEHIRSKHTREGILTCSACSKEFANRRQWALHEANVCKVEGQGWSEERLKTEFNIVLLPCPHPGCDKLFDRPSAIKYHMPTHTGARPFPCSTCGKSFSSKCGLTQHSALCDPDAPPSLRQKITALRQQQRGFRKRFQFPCLLCQPRKHFSKAVTLREHNAKFHPNNAQASKVLCDLCGLSYPPHRLSAHRRRVHEGLLPFPCSHPPCDKRFFAKRDMLRHFSKVHEGKKHVGRYPCDQCDAVFRQRSSLPEHRARFHGEGRNLSCPKCPRRFLKRRELRNHLASHERAGAWCGDCGRNFGSLRQLEEHQEKLDGKVCEPKYWENNWKMRARVGLGVDVEVDEVGEGVVIEEQERQEVPEKE